MNKRFIVECEMKDRWVPYFLSMLKSMQSNSMIGHSGKVSIFADGDGDFYARFNFDGSLLNQEVKPIVCNSDEVYYDAG